MHMHMEAKAMNNYVQVRLCQDMHIILHIQYIESNYVKY